VADWQRHLDRGGDDAEATGGVELQLEEEKRLLEPELMEDLAKVASLFLVLSGIKGFFYLFGIFRPSWLTSLVDRLGLDGLLIFSCALWMTIGCRLFVGLLIIGIVVAVQTLFIGGFVAPNMLRLGMTVAEDAVYLGAGILLGLIFRRR